MIITEADFRKFNLPLRVPLIGKEGIIKSRAGLILKLVSDIGFSGYGEASPAEPLTPESFEEAKAGCDYICTKLCGTEVPESLNEIGEASSIFNHLPSVKFAFEQALISILIQKNGFEHIAGLQPADKIHVSCSIGAFNLDEVLKLASSYLSAGFSTIKLKTGRDNSTEDIEIITALRKQLGFSFSLRLDCGASYNYNTALQFLKNLDGLSIEFAADPVMTASELVRLSETTNVPLAAGNILTSVKDAESLISGSNVKYLIINPILTGAFSDTLKLISSSAPAGKKIIIKSGFENILGKDGLVMLAGYTGHKSAHGIGIISYFDENLFPDYLQVKNGILIPPYDKFLSNFHLNNMFK